METRESVSPWALAIPYLAVVCAIAYVATFLGHGVMQAWTLPAWASLMGGR